MRHALALLLLPLLAFAASCLPSRPEAVVLLGGDVHGEPPIAQVLQAGGDPLAALAGAFADADVVVVNLETPVGPGGAEADKDITFRADPVLLDRLAEAGVDVVSLANNHALDHGVEGLQGTIAEARERGIAVVGAGPDEEAAWAPAVLEAAGRRIAVVGMSDVVPDRSWVAGDGWGIASALDHDRAAAAVEAAAAQADHVVVTVHWGNEFRECPSVVQTELARRLVAAGADVVAGHHPHVVQGVEERDGATVAYSLGNLLFYAASPETRDGALLRAALHPGGEVAADLLPVVLDAHGRPFRPSPEAEARIAERIRVRSPGGGTCPGAVWDGLPERTP